MMDSPSVFVLQLCLPRTCRTFIELYDVLCCVLLCYLERTVKQVRWPSALRSINFVVVALVNRKIPSSSLSILFRLLVVIERYVLGHQIHIFTHPRFNYRILINLLFVTDCIYGHQTDLHFITLQNFNVLKNLLILTRTVVIHIMQQGQRISSLKTIH